MGVNTDGKEKREVSTVPDGLDPNEVACEFVLQPGNEKKLPEEVACDIRIHDQKPVHGSYIQPIFPMYNMPQRHTSDIPNTDHNEAKEQHRNAGDSALSALSQRHYSNTVEDASESMQLVLVAPNTDTSVDVEERLSPPSPAEIMELLDTENNDDWDAIYETLQEEMQLCDTEMIKQDLPINPDIDLTDEEGYTHLYKAALEGRLESVDDLISQGANPNKPCKGGLTPLHAAAQEGHEDIVDYLILQGADVNVECEMGRTPLHIAAEKDHTNIMQSLLAEGTNVNKKDNTGWTPFNAAVKYGHLEAVKYLMANGAKQSRNGGKIPLYYAAKFGHLDIVKFIISKGADVNEEDDDETISLHSAALENHIGVMEYLVRQGSDMQKSTIDGWTPFNAAVQNGHLEAVKYLMANGAKQNAYSGMTPLYAAAKFGHLDLVKFFTSIGCDVNEENDEGKIPLHGAAIHGNIEVIKYLIQEGSDVNKGDAKGWTPFNAAVRHGHLEAVKYLTANEAKQNIYDGMSPPYAAAQFGHLDLVKFFVSEGADVNEEDNNGRIPLHGAAIHGNIEIMQYLIQQGSDVNKGDARGWTPFNAAVEFGHLEAVKYLMANGAKQNRYHGMTPLYLAARYGHLHIVKFLISEGGDVSEENDSGRIPLHGAAIHGNTEVMEYLIQQGSDFTKRDSKGWTPFNASVQYGHLEAVTYLIANGAKQNIYDGMTPLYAAAQFGQLDLVKYFISEGADVNEEDEIGQIPLHGAAAVGHQEVLEYLIQQGSDVQKKDHNCWTPFYASVRNGHLEAIKLLLANRANSTKINGLTLLYIATQHDHKSVVEFLVSKVYDVNESNESGKLPIHAACYKGSLDIVKCLYDQNANVNEKDRYAWSPLHAAAQEGHRDVVAYLTLNGADITAKDINGLTPLHAAAQEGHRDVVEFLALNGADITAKDINGMTPLHAAAQEGHQDVVEFLILKGEDITAQDIDGMTSLQAAKKGGHAKVVEYMTVREGDTLNEDISDSIQKSHQRDTQRHHTSKNLEALLEDEDMYGREGKTPIKSPETRFDAEQSSDAATTDSMDGYTLVDANEDAIHSECLPTVPAVVGKLEKDESNPFVSAMLKIPEKSATTAEQKQVNGSKSLVPVDRESRPGRDSAEKICPAPYDGLTSVFTNDRDHNAFSLLNAHLTWKRGGFDQSSLHTTEANRHSYDETVLRCHKILEEPFSSMNAQNDQRTTRNEEKFERPKNPLADEDHHKSKDGNPTKRKSTHSEWKRKKKCRSVDTHCSSFLVLVQSLLHVIIALAIILSRSPVLVAGSVNIERVTLQAGQPAVIPFDIPLSPDNTSQIFPHFILRFGSKLLPFCINGEDDLEGFKSPSQFPRFTTSVAEMASSICVKVNINPVDIIDQDLYVLRAYFHVYGETVIVKKEILVQIPPGRAKCFLTISENNNYPYEVHCQATLGSIKTTLTCYQYGRRVEVKGDVTNNGQVTRAVFLLPDQSPFSCCSHAVTSEVNVTMCNDFAWPPSNNHISPSTANDPTITPSVANIIDPIGNTEQASNTLVESQVDSGACKEYMASLVSLTIGLMIYLFLCEDVVNS